MTTDTIKFKRGVKSKLNNLSYGEPAYISDENELYIGTENGVEKITHNKEVAELSSQLAQNTNNLSILNKEKINILSYSDYVIDNNWTEAIKKALEEAENSNCKIVYFPCGTYTINSDSIIVPNDVSLVGASETNSIIKGLGKTNLGAGIQLGVRCTISNLYIRDFEIGIKNTNYWNKIYDCKIYNNTIGIQLISSYICKIKNNEITFNDVGLLIEGEAYECIIKDNIIDNNNLGLGIYGGSNGLIISDNTIEGNRNHTTGVGCGILLKGTNHSRCKISGNWFEANGDTQDSVDVFLGAENSTTHADAIALWDNILDNCVPNNYKSNLSSDSLSVGAIDLSNNAHIFTKYGVLVGGYRCNIHIHDCYFKGSLDKYNKHIVITQLSSEYNKLNLSIDNCNAENSDGMTTITPQILTGIKGTYVHAIDPPSGEYTNILFNNKPLFIKELTLNEVLENYNCIKLQQVKANGTATNIPNRCVLIGDNERFTTNSYYSNSGANILVGTEGNDSTTEAILTPDAENGNYFFTIGVPYSEIKYENMSSWTTINVGVLAKKVALKTGKFYTYTQTGYEGIFYLVSLSKEQYEKNFKDVYKVIITDATYYLQGTIPE